MCHLSPFCLYITIEFPRIMHNSYGHMLSLDVNAFFFLSFFCVDIFRRFHVSWKELSSFSFSLWQGIGILLDGLFGTCTGSTVSV